MRYNTAPSSIMFATVRIKRTPIGNKRIAFVLRVAHATPVHTHALHEEDISLMINSRGLAASVEALRERFNCRRVEVDVANDAAKIIARNDEGALQAA
jgi:hypothetical protein